MLGDAPYSTMRGGITGPKTRSDQPVRIGQVPAIWRVLEHAPHVRRRMVVIIAACDVCLNRYRVGLGVRSARGGTSCGGLEYNDIAAASR